MSTGPLRLLAAHRDGLPAGIVSVCSAHELVIEAALLQALEDDSAALIEATCNQVNQEGGYTGMRPEGFRDFVFGIADRVGLSRSRIILGGDHLGPNPWKHLPAGQAMQHAREMIAAYAAAGYEKLHLDASMGCAGEPAALADDEVARRAADLAACAEAVATAQPVYVIGTEVPVPGGATGDHGDALDALVPTAPDAVLATHAVHAQAFAAHGAAGAAAWKRVIGIVVQPGVEFGHERVAIYRPEAAAGLAAALGRMPGLVYEAHSTDYQPPAALAALVRDGFSILKVGPGLSFALREALYGLDAIARILDPTATGPGLPDRMEALMLAEPGHWRSHYPGNAAAQKVLRHYSYSDRIRYYWPDAEARRAVAELVARLDATPIPETLISQHLPRLHERVMTGAVPARPRALLVEAVRDVLRTYARATRAVSQGDHHAA